MGNEGYMCIMTRTSTGVLAKLGCEGLAVIFTITLPEVCAVDKSRL